MSNSEWINIRRLLWDDDEQIMIANSVKQVSPMKRAGKITVQPKAQYCCGNSFRAGSKKCNRSISRLHTWVIEHDEEMPLSHQRELWRHEKLPHTLRVFSGGKSIHVYIRTVEDVDAETWKRIADDLLLIFPLADKTVLGVKSTFSRLPWGVRIEGDQNIDQKVETTKTRIPLQTLLEWIAEQDVIKERACDIDKEEFPLKTGSKEGVKNKEAWEEFKRTLPGCAYHYRKLIQHRVVAEQGRRNSELIALMTFAFDSVCEEVALSFAEWFYRLHADVFEDTFEQHMIEAHDHQRNMLASYPAKLSQHEREIYEGMEGREKAFFRICRSLSKCEALEGRLFYIPLTKFGYRMNLHTEQIKRLVKSFIADGMLRLVRQGTRHCLAEDGTITKGVAGTYEWILKDQCRLTASCVRA